VLGAGVMGAQIAAHLVNANVDTVLFDLPRRKAPFRPNGIVDKAIANLGKLSPAPAGAQIAALAAASSPPANYDGAPARCCADCDLIIEAIAERMDWKKDLYAKIAPHVARTRCWPATPRACRSTRWPMRCPSSCAALLRRPFLQPAALHAPGRADPDARHRPGVLDGSRPS
jgi:hypothetical protein